MKKTSYINYCGLLYLSASLAANAGGIFVEVSPEETQPVFIGSEPHRLVVGASALYLQPVTNASLINYATLQAIDQTPTITINPQTTVKSINRDFDFGFDIFAKYNFPDTDRDIEVSFMRFSDTDSDGTGIVSLPQTTPIYNQFYHTAEGKIQTSLAMIDALLGQNVHLGDDLQLHLFAGLTYASIKENVTNAYDVNQGTNTMGSVMQRSLESYTKISSEFQGVGPKLGVEATYFLGLYNLGLVGGISAGLLTGPLHTRQHKLSNVGPNLVFPTVANRRFDPNTISVTNLNANLGVMYEYDRFSVEAGYQVNEFLGAVSRDDDFDVSGAYVTLTSSFF